MAYRDVMELPMQVFWQLSGFVDRLMADEHRGLLEILLASQNGDLAKEAFERLGQIAPHPIKFTGHAHIAAAKLDKEGLDQLRSLG